MSSSDFDWVDHVDWSDVSGAPTEMAVKVESSKRGRPAKPEAASKPALADNIRWHCNRMGIKNARELRDFLFLKFKQSTCSVSHADRALKGDPSIQDLDQFYTAFGIPDEMSLEAEDHIEQAKAYFFGQADTRTKTTIREKLNKLVDHATVHDVRKIQHFLDLLS